MQDVQGVKALSLEVSVHLVGRGPPVIVVSFHDQLLAGKLLQKRKIPARIVQAHGPADIPRQHDGVLGFDQLAPVALQPLHIAVPPRKNIHGFGSAQ